jgi:AraC-like DNA-binding protein
MPGSVTSVFSEPDDFQAALHREGGSGLLVTAFGDFRARLTQLDLHSLRLSAVEEALPRILFLAVPPNELLASFPIGDLPSPIWGGMGPGKGEFLTFGPGHRVHMRTHGPCRWGAIRFAVGELADYFQKLTEATLAVPPVAQCWHPPGAAARRLLQLHAAATRAGEYRPKLIVDAEASHGMEQQLIDAFVECLSAGPSEACMQSKQRLQEIAIRFEDLLADLPDRHRRVADYSAALGISDRLLRTSCRETLGMSAAGYVRLRALHRIHRILRGGDAPATRVSQVANCHGFRDLGAFASAYRVLFGEPPSATLRRATRCRRGTGFA